jgi:hypothetical protein
MIDPLFAPCGSQFKVPGSRFKVETFRIPDFEP